MEAGRLLDIRNTYKRCDNHILCKEGEGKKEKEHSWKWIHFKNTFIRISIKSFYL